MHILFTQLNNKIERIVTLVLYVFYLDVPRQENLIKPFFKRYTVRIEVEKQKDSTTFRLSK